MPKSNESIDWLRVFIHGFIGTVMGAAVGVALWAFVFPDFGHWIMIAMAALCGTLAAICGDDFWDSFREGSRWNPLNWW